VVSMRIKHIKSLGTSVQKHRALGKLWKDLGISAGEEAKPQSNEKGGREMKVTFWGVINAVLFLIWLSQQEG